MKNWAIGIFRAILILISSYSFIFGFLILGSVRIQKSYFAIDIIVGAISLTVLVWHLKKHKNQHRNIATMLFGALLLILTSFFDFALLASSYIVPLGTKFSYIATSLFFFIVVSYVFSLKNI